MLTFQRVRRSILQGTIFGVAMWIFDSLHDGSGDVRLTRYLVTAGIFAIVHLLFSYVLGHLFGKTRTPSKPATLRETLKGVDRIVHSGKQSADLSDKG